MPVVYIIVLFLLDDYLASEFSVPTFRNTMFHLHTSMNMEKTEFSETSAHKIQKLAGNRSKERIQYSQRDVSFK